MLILTNVELSLGYEHWKEKMLANEPFRQANNIKLLAYGYEEDNPAKVWAVIETPSLEHMMGLMNAPEMVKLREEAGAIVETQKMIKLVS